MKQYSLYLSPDLDRNYLNLKKVTNTGITTEVLPRIGEVEEEIEKEEDGEVIINNEQNAVSLESENGCKKEVKIENMNIVGGQQIPQK